MPIAVSLRYPPGRIISIVLESGFKTSGLRSTYTQKDLAYRKRFHTRGQSPDWNLNGRVLLEDPNWCLHPLAQNQRVAAQSANNGIWRSCPLGSIAIVIFLPSSDITTSCEALPAYAQVQLSDARDYKGLRSRPRRAPQEVVRRTRDSDRRITLGSATSSGPVFFYKLGVCFLLVLYLKSFLVEYMGDAC